MKGRNLILLAGLLGAVVLLFSFVYADPPDRPMKQMNERLGLTDSQAKQMRDIQYNFTKTGIGLRADLKEARLELNHQMAQENANKNEVAKLVDKVAEAHKALLKHQVDRKMAMKEILTPEQFEKFLRMRGGMMMGERMGQRMGKGMGEGRGSRRHAPKGCGPRGDGPGI